MSNKRISWGDKNDKRWAEWTAFKGTIFITGHGNYKTSGGEPVQVPKGCKFTLYEEMGQSIHQEEVERILAGEELSVGLQVAEMKQCPKLILSPEDDAAHIEGSRAALAKYLADEKHKEDKCRILSLNQFTMAEVEAAETDKKLIPKMTLAEIYRALPGPGIHFVWLCCAFKQRVGKEVPRVKPKDTADKPTPQLAAKLEEMRKKVEDHFVSNMIGIDDAKKLKLEKQELKDMVVKAAEVFADFAFELNMSGTLGIASLRFMDVVKVNPSQKEGYTGGFRGAHYEPDQQAIVLAKAIEAAKKVPADKWGKFLKKLVLLDRGKLAEAAKLTPLTKYKELATVKDLILVHLAEISTDDFLKKARQVMTEGKDTESIAVLDKVKALKAKKS